MNSCMIVMAGNRKTARGETVCVDGAWLSIYKQYMYHIADYTISI